MLARRYRRNAHLNVPCCHQAAFGNQHRTASAAPTASNTLDSLHHCIAIDHLSEDNVLAIQPCSLSSAEEELAAVSARSSIGHRQHARPCMLELEILICKLLTVDGFTSCAILTGEIPPLAHEVWNDTMEGTPFVPEAFLPSAQGPEILAGFRGHICLKLHCDATQSLAPNLHFEKDLEPTWGSERRSVVLIVFGIDGGRFARGRTASAKHIV